MHHHTTLALPDLSSISTVPYTPGSTALFTSPGSTAAPRGIVKEETNEIKEKCGYNFSGCTKEEDKKTM
jgi:hypothetical protein